MVARSVYRYAAGPRAFPVLILDPLQEVWPDERVGTKDGYGRRLKVTYIRGSRASTPGMLGILWRSGTHEEQAHQLSALRRLSQKDLLTDTLGASLLPREAVAVVVYPRNIRMSWASWQRIESELEEQRRIKQTPEEQKKAAERAKEQAAAFASAQAREDAIVGAVRLALGPVGSLADVTCWAIRDPGDQDDTDMLDVTVELKLEQLMEILDVDLPDWARRQLPSV